MSTTDDESRDRSSRREELFARVGDALKIHEGRNLLERYALYMMRIQMYELSLKQDLQSLFGVSEERAETMSLNGILRYYVDHDIRAHPILYENVREIARQRNSMAHDFLAVTSVLADLDDNFVALPARDLDKWTWELELAVQEYLMLKESGQLYRDWGVKPEWEAHPQPV